MYESGVNETFSILGVIGTNDKIRVKLVYPQHLLKKKDKKKNRNVLEA